MEKTPHGYFNSWGWVSVWLASLPDDQEIRLLAAFLGDEPVMGLFIGRTRGLRYGFLPSHTFAMNATGNPRFDQILIEYNRAIIAPGFEPNWTELWEAVGHWDEFILPGIASDFTKTIESQIDAIGKFHLITDKVENSYWVDLQKIRSANMDYLSLLSSNRRSQIRRSLREYTQEGEIKIRQAGSRSEALEMYTDLIELHQREWKKRGKLGAFANDYFCTFHQSLINERFESGEIQLLRVDVDMRPIGFLYSFSYQERVYFYQSGFSYGEGNAQRPGLVSHYLAILHNANLGLGIYDFLAGEAQYKSSLATHSEIISWVRLIHGSARLQFEESLLAIRNRIKSMPELLLHLKSIRDRFRSQ